MKLLILFLAFLTALPLGAVEPSSFDPAPFRLEPTPSSRSAVAVPAIGVSLPLAIGPVRIDYGHPIPAENMQRFHSNLDAPGPGYREQSAKALSR